MATLFDSHFQAINASGVPYSGATLEFDQTGTTTKITVYQDSGKVTPHTNPVTADASGLFPPIYTDTGVFKIVLKDSGGTEIQSVDPVYSIGLVPDGTVSAPGIAFASDTNNGFYRIGADDWAVSAGGVKVLGFNGTTGTSAIDSLFQIIDNSDATKKAKFEASGITTSTTRTYLLPNASARLGLASNANIKVTFPSGFNMQIDLVGEDGNAPSVTNPVYIAFRNEAARTGSVTYVAVTAAVTLTITGGSTMGTVGSGFAFNIWVVAFNDAGTIRLGAIMCAQPVTGMPFYPLQAHGTASSTAEGGAGGADSGQTFYTGTAVTSASYTTLGRLQFSGGVSVAGNWQNTTSTLPYLPGDPLPGHQRQKVWSTDGGVASGTTLIPADNTIPQITEGDQYMSVSIANVDPASALFIEHDGEYTSTVATQITAALFVAAIGVDARLARTTAVIIGGAMAISMRYFENVPTLASSGSATVTVRAGGANAGTVRFNGFSGAQVFNGRTLSNLSITEIQT